MPDFHFVFTSWGEIPRYFFVGYCFKGTDFIVGAGGAEQYRAATGNRIGKDEDGCYAELVRDGDRIQLHTDFRGNMRLFYYADGDRWAVSSSWLRLAQALRAQGIALTPDRAQLAAWFSQNLNFKQLTCYQTALREIRLFPVHGKIVIDRNGFAVVPVPLTNSASYGENLSRYLSLWQNRCATLLRGLPGPMKVDITGGLDSRAALGLLAQRADTGRSCTPPRIDFGTSGAAHFSRDAEIAELIARHLNVPLQVRTARAAQFVVAEERVIALWKASSLGQYAPVRFAVPRFDLANVSLGGSGGESLRGIYDDACTDTYVRAQAKRHATHMPSDPGPWARDLTDTLGQIADHYGDDKHILLHYFREFRSRLHAGTTARSGISVQPLVGRAAHACMLALDPGRIRAGQILYDIMHNLDPGLLEIPFDEDHKAPGAQNRADLTTVRVGAPDPGQIYARSETAPEPGGARPMTRDGVYAALAREVRENLSAIPDGLLCPEYLDGAIDALAQAQDPAITLRARDTIPIHNIVLLQELAKLTDLAPLSAPPPRWRSRLARLLGRAG